MAYPNHEVLFSIPVPIIIGAAAAIGLLITVGWRLRKRRVRAADPPPAGWGAPWLPALLDALPLGVLITDAHGKRRLANHQALCWLEQTDPSGDFHQAVHSLVERVKASGEREGPEAHTLPGHKDLLWIEAAPLGEAEAILVVITEDRAKGTTDGIHQRLTQLVAHELRTPLTAIMGHTDILGSCSIEEEDLWRRSQQFIAAQAERLARLVEDLLAFSRLDVAAPNFAPVNLRAVAEQAISTAWQSAEAKGIMLALQAPGSLPRVRGDADRLLQVFTNLLDNGLKYTPPGGRVIVQMAMDTDRVCVEVNDTGIGIPASDLPHLCEPFFRSEQARQTAPGTGLGLTIARAILIHHGVDLQVKSVLQHGASFSFYLPVTH